MQSSELGQPIPNIPHVSIGGFFEINKLTTCKGYQRIPPNLEGGGGLRRGRGMGTKQDEDRLSKVPRPGQSNPIMFNKNVIGFSYTAASQH